MKTTGRRAWRARQKNARRLWNRLNHQRPLARWQILDLPYQRKEWVRC